MWPSPISEAAGNDEFRRTNDERMTKAQMTNDEARLTTTVAVRPSSFVIRNSSFADVGHQRHEARPFDGVLDRALEGGAVAAALAAEHLALAGAELLERLHVLVVHERRPRAACRRAETAAV